MSEYRDYEQLSFGEEENKVDPVVDSEFLARQKEYETYKRGYYAAENEFDLAMGRKGSFDDYLKKHGVPLDFDPNDPNYNIFK